MDENSERARQRGGIASANAVVPRTAVYSWLREFVSRPLLHYTYGIMFFSFFSLN